MILDTIKSLFYLVDDYRKYGLTLREWDILRSHNIKRKYVKNGDIILTVTPDTIIARTKPETWQHLAGRQWELDRKTLQFRLTMMN